MALRPERDRAIRTARDEAREQQREALALQWARIDADIADALGEGDLGGGDVSEVRSVP